MATQTHVVTDSGGIRIVYDYDDANLRVLAVRVDNQSAQTCYVEAVQTISIGQAPTGRKYSALFLPGSLTEIPIPTGPNARLQLQVDARGRLDGISLTILVPAP